MLAGLIIRQPAAAAGALLCTWAIDQWARSQDEYFIYNRGITNWLTSIMLAIALALRIFKGKTVFRPMPREYLWALGLYFLALTSYLWSIRPDDTLEQFGNNYRVLLVFAFFLPLSISDLADLKSTLYTILSVGFVIALLVLATGQWDGRKLKFMTDGLFVDEGFAGGNPLAIASNAAYVAMAAMLMNFRGAARFWQVFRYVVIGVAFAISVKSGSRGQTVAILFCVLCFLPYSRRFKDMQSFGAFAVSISLFAIITLVLISRLTAAEDVGGAAGSRWTYEGFVGEYESGRVETSVILLNAWANAGPLRWVIGLGSSASFDPLICGFYPHVVFAEVLGELGVIGWLILWLFPIFSYRNLRESWSYVKDNAEERGLMATLGAMVLFEIIMSFKQGSLLGSGPLFGMIAILGRVTLTLRARRVEQNLLDAGMYPMSPTDWEDTDEAYDDAIGEGAVVAR